MTVKINYTVLYHMIMYVICHSDLNLNLINCPVLISSQSPSAEQQLPTALPKRIGQMSYASNKVYSSSSFELNHMKQKL